MWSGLRPDVSWMTLKLVGLTVPWRTDWFTRKKSYLRDKTIMSSKPTNVLKR